MKLLIDIFKVRKLGFSILSPSRNFPFYDPSPARKRKSIFFWILGILFLISQLAVFPSEGSSNRGIVAVPIKDLQGKQVGLYKASYALVVGISDYTGGWPNLPGVKEDVKAIKEILEDIGFEVILVENLNQKELEAAFKNFVLEYGLDPENRILIYYAGHGHTHKPDYATDDPEEWMGYLVSRNAPDPKDNLANFFKNALSMRTIESIALTVESKHALFIFDSCFSGTIFGLSRSIPQDIQERTAKPVRQFITSGTADQVVPDISIFRRQLISALQGEADRNQDGYVTGSELGLYLEETVTNLSNRTQTPRYGKIQNRFLNKGDFVFNITKDAPEQTASLKHDNLINSINKMTDEIFAQRGKRSSRIEIHFSKLKELDKFNEESISRKTKIKLWKDFITLYPNNNPHLETAKEILANLRNPKQPPVEVQPIEQSIESRHASLLDMDRNGLGIQEKISAWLGFISDYPINNPKMDFALNRITELREEQKKQEAEKRLAEQRRLAEEEARRQEQQRLAAEEAERKEQERLAEQKHLAEEEARRQEQQRLAAEEAERKEQERLAEQKRLAEEEARQQEQQRLAEQRQPSSGSSGSFEVSRLEPGTVKSTSESPGGNQGMVLIPAGEYVSGELDSRDVKVLGAFYMDVYEVTQEAYQEIIGNNPSRFKGENLPVEKVTWQEAQEFCKRVGKRLPTSEEWEKAARAGSSSKYYWGNELGTNMANCNDCGSKFDGLETAPVGGFPPNAWGLYDMAGNVWEWVDQSYRDGFKILRGGSWMDDSSFVHSAGSYFVRPDNRSGDIGFRCAKEK